MKDKTKGRLNFGLGLFSGVVIGYYLSSDEGQKLRRVVQQRLDEISEELGERVQEQIGMVSQGVESVLLKGKEYAEDVSGSVGGEMDRTTDSAEDVITSAKSSFFKGMEKARRRVEGEEQSGKKPNP